MCSTAQATLVMSEDDNEWHSVTELVNHTAIPTRPWVSVDITQLKSFKSILREFTWDMQSFSHVNKRSKQVPTTGHWISLPWVSYWRSRGITRASQNSKIATTPRNTVTISHNHQSTLKWNQKLSKLRKVLTAQMYDVLTDFITSRVLQWSLLHLGFSSCTPSWCGILQVSSYICKVITLLRSSLVDHDEAFHCWQKAEKLDNFGISSSCKLY